MNKNPASYHNFEKDFRLQFATELGDVCLLLERNGNIIDANSVFVKMFNIKDTDLKKFNFVKEFYLEGVQSKIEEELMDIVENGTRVKSLERVKIDENVNAVLSTTKIRTDLNNEPVVLFYATIMSYQYQGESELRISLDHEYIDQISREIRGQIQVIIGFLDLMKDEEVTEDEFEEFSQIIEYSCYNLSSLISSILDKSMIRNASIFEVEPVSIKDLFLDLERIFKVQAMIKNIKLRAVSNDSRDINISINRSLLFNALYILLENALNSTKEGVIEYEYFNSINSVAIIIVADPVENLFIMGKEEMMELDFMSIMSRTRQNVILKERLKVARLIIEKFNGYLLISYRNNKVYAYLDIPLNHIPVVQRPVDLN